MGFIGNGSGITNLGALISTQLFTSSGTWNRPSGTTKIRVTVTGGGGSASGVPGDLGNDMGGSGSAGGTAIKIIDVTSISSVSVTVGNGGTVPLATSGSTGAAGQTSSFGSHCSASGGSGAPSYSNTSNVSQFPSGDGSGGDINIRGGHGLYPKINESNANTISGHMGGASYWGGSGRPAMDDDFTGANANFSGNAASGWGSGGAGAARSFSGGNGKQGIVVVENFK